MATNEVFALLRKRSNEHDGESIEEFASVGNPELALEAREALEALVGRLEDEDVEAAYQEDRAVARSAAGSPADAQGKAAPTPDGRARYTAPTLVFEADGRTLIAGGRQPLEVYDALISNLDPQLDRRGPADDAREAVAAFEHGLTTREVALLLAEPGVEPDDRAALEQLIGLAGEGALGCVPMGDGALWVPVQRGAFERLGRVRDLLASASGS